MTNALIDAIRVNEPFYSDTTVTEKKNRIYCHQFESWIELIALGLRDFCFYIGQTEPERGWKVVGEYLIRFADGDTPNVQINLNFIVIGMCIQISKTMRLGKS